MTTKSKENKTPDMDPWNMACAVLTALHQTEGKARNDYHARSAAAGENPFARGVSEAGALVQVLQESRRFLEHQMYRHARSSGLVIPELKR